MLPFREITLVVVVAFLEPSIRCKVLIQAVIAAVVGITHVDAKAVTHKFATL